MSDDLWVFFYNMPDEGYKIEGSHCTGDQCNTYEGNINPNDIWTFYLTSQDGKITQKVETSIVNCYEPRICFNIENQGEKIPLEVSPQDCEITEDNSSLHINTSNQDHTFNIVIRKA